MLQICQHIYRAFCVTAICDDLSQQVFFAQMTSCAVHYDIIYHPYQFSIFEDMGVDNPVNPLSPNSPNISIHCQEIKL